MKIEVPISKANRIINPGCVIMVTSLSEKRPNIIVLAWQMPTSREPVLVAISIGAGRYSHELISVNKEFVINVPTADMLGKVMLCGARSGRDIDKFELAELTPLSGKFVKPPLIKECAAHLECKVRGTFDTGDHTIFIGEIVRACAEENLFEETWNIKNKKAELLFHLGGDRFTTCERLILAK